MNGQEKATKHCTLRKGIGIILETADKNAQGIAASPEIMLRMNLSGEMQIRALILSIREAYMDIYALSEYLSLQASHGAFHAAHHFLMMLHISCGLLLPLEMMESIRSDACLRSYIAGVLRGLWAEERAMNGRYAQSAALDDETGTFKIQKEDAHVQ